MEINRKINFLLLWCAAPASARLIAPQNAPHKGAFFSTFFEGNENQQKINFLLLRCAAPASARLIAQQGASQKEAFFLPFWKRESILWLSFASPKSISRPYPLPPTHNLHFTNTNKCANLPKYCDAAPLLKKCRGYNLTRNDTQDFRTNSRCLSHL